MNILIQHPSESHPSMFDDIEKSVQVQPLNLEHYPRKAVYARDDKIVNQINPQRNIDQTHCFALAIYFRNYNQDHSRGMMTMYFLSTVNLEGALCATEEQTVDVMQVQKDGYFMVPLNGRQSHRSVKSVQNKNRSDFAPVPLSMRYAICADGKTILLAQAFRLSKIASISTVIVRRKTMFTDTMQILLSYARAVEEDYGVRFINVCMLCIVYNILSTIVSLRTLGKLTYATLRLARR